MLFVYISAAVCVSSVLGFCVGARVVLARVERSRARRRRGYVLLRVSGGQSPPMGGAQPTSTSSSPVPGHRWAAQDELERRRAESRTGAHTYSGNGAGGNPGLPPRDAA